MSTQLKIEVDCPNSYGSKIEICVHADNAIYLATIEKDVENHFYLELSKKDWEKVKEFIDSQLNKID